MTPARRAIRWRGLIGLTLLAVHAAGQAQQWSGTDVEVPSVDWYYASAFGTGQYRAGERTVTVLRIPVAWTAPAPEGRDWTVRLLAPVTLDHDTHQHYANLRHPFLAGLRSRRIMQLIINDEQLNSRQPVLEQVAEVG